MADSERRANLSTKLNSLITAATADKQKVPGVVFRAVDRHGNIISSVASGLKSIAGQDPMSVDTTFWIASCTKLVSAIALMQLVERGEADLDSADQLEAIVPELRDVQILENGKLKPKINRITLRSLMTHTAGFTYSFLDEEIWTNHLRRDPTRDEFQGAKDGILQPLVFEPGTKYEYSIGIDWAGVFIERLTKSTLGEYMEKNIFLPLGITNMTFSASSEMRSNMAGMHQRGETLTARPHLYRPAREDMKDPFHSAGAGLLSNALDYSQILTTILNDGRSPKTQQRILKKETIDKMFQNQVLDYAAKYAPYTHHVARSDLIVPPTSEKLQTTGYQGWGINFQVMGGSMSMSPMTYEKNGFPRGSATGISNCFWALDREKGVGGILMSQILPFGDPYVFPLWTSLQDVLFED